jgi:hypothetical protein
MTTQAIGHAAPRTTSLTIPVSRLWTGRVLTAIPILFLTFDGAGKVANVAPVREAMAQLGYPADTGVAIGIILLVCVALYAIPRTAVLGAILLTGYLGGAIATHVRVGNPLFSHILFPIYLAAMVWGGLYLRDARLRALVPLRTAE